MNCCPFCGRQYPHATTRVPSHNYTKTFNGIVVRAYCPGSGQPPDNRADLPPGFPPSPIAELIKESSAPMRFDLEAVGQDWDGTFKPIDQLTARVVLPARTHGDDLPGPTVENAGPCSMCGGAGFITNPANDWDETECPQCRPWPFVVMPPDPPKTG